MVMVCGKEKQKKLIKKNTSYKWVMVYKKKPFTLGKMIKISYMVKIIIERELE